MKKLYQRWQKETIENALKTRRVILLCGARQSGKTTLAKQLTIKDTAYRTLDDIAIKQLAINDPHGFVKHTGKMLIIDEIQRAPELLSAIKLVVDENTQLGQYLLTSSANIQSLPGVQESLAGRIRKVRLRPLSQGELLGKEPIFLDKAFNQSFYKAKKSIYDRKAMLEIAFRGGFPETINLSANERTQWHKDYISALLKCDLSDIARITRYRAIQELINILAAWSGKFMDISAIGSGLSIRRPTIETYINTLESLYIVERIEPWTHTDYERVGKHSKLYMSDSGLMSSILKWRVSQVELDSDRSGKLIELLFLVSLRLKSMLVTENMNCSIIATEKSATLIF